MKYIAEIDVMPKPELLDPQGKAVKNNLKNIAVQGVSDVRIGKHVRVEIEAADEATAKEMVDKACAKLLSNPIMETYTYSLATS